MPDGFFPVESWEEHFGEQTHATVLIMHFQPAFCIIIPQFK